MKNLKSLGGKAQAIATGLNVSASAIGQAIPVWYGRTRGPGMLIWTGNFRSVKGVSKKGTQAKGRLTGYYCGADWLLGYGPMEGIGGVWEEKSFWASYLGSNTQTQAGPASTFTFSINNVPAGTNLEMIVGVTIQQNYSVVYNDYGAPSAVSLSGTTNQPLPNQGFPAPNNGDWQYSNQPYAVYNTTFGSPSVTVTFPTSQSSVTVTIYYLYTSVSTFTPLSFRNLSFEPRLGSGGSGQPVTYPEFSGVSGQNIDCGIVNMLPNFTYEGKGLYGYSPQGDCNPADIIIDLICSGNYTQKWGGTAPSPVWQHGLNFTNFFYGITSIGISQYNPAFSRFGGILQDEPNLWGPGFSGGSNIGLSAVRNYCQAYGIYISYRLETQQTGDQVLSDLCDIANCAPVWDGSQLWFIPYCEVSAFGNGASFVAPTAAGPLFTFNDNHFLQKDAKGNPKAPLVHSRTRPKDNFNSFDIEYTNRFGSTTTPGSPGWYTSDHVTISDMGEISTQGPIVGSTKTLRWIQDGPTAINVGWAILKRNSLNKRVVQWSLPPQWFTLTPMDLVTLVDPSLPWGQIDVRITKVTENEKYDLDFEGEQFIYGQSTPLAPGVSAPSGGGTPLPGSSADPGSVNAPIIFEAIPAISVAPQLWLKISGLSQYFGGCTVYMSTDGGSTYNPIGRFFGQSVMGSVYNINFPSHADPDTVDTCYVDVSESQSTLPSYTTGQRDALQALFWLSGGGTVVVNGVTLTIPYELISYATATLQATSKYALVPTIRRGAYGTPIAAHNVGVACCSLEDSEVFQINIDPNWIGTTLFFKFTAFNIFGQNEQVLTDPNVVAYSFSPTGNVGWTWNAGIPTPPPTITPQPIGGYSSAGPNDVYMFVPGTFQASQVLFETTFVENSVLFPINLNGSVAKCRNLPTGSVVVTLQKNGVSIGTVNFAANATSGTFTFSSGVSFTPAVDLFSVIAPASADPTFGGLELSIKASHG